MNNRRLFLKGLLLGASAPAIVKAESLMKIVVPKPVFPWYTPAGLMRGEIGVIEDFRVVVDDMAITRTEVVAKSRAGLSEWMLDPDRGSLFIRASRGPISPPFIFRDESTFQALAYTDRRTHRS